MRNSLIALVTVPWLLMATVSMAQGTASKQSINFVEVIQIDSKTQTFRAQLVNLNTKMVLVDKVGKVDKAGKGADLEAFKEQSAKVAPREQTLSIMGPGLAVATAGTVNPPPPPGPAGGDLLQIVRDISRSYEKIEIIQPVQLQLNPKMLPPSKINTLPQATQPNTTPVTPAVRQ